MRDKNRRKSTEISLNKMCEQIKTIGIYNYYRN